MLPGDIHRKKRQKNMIVGLSILAWVALIWAITMIKMTHGG
jgi:hypothetical protein